MKYARKYGSSGTFEGIQKVITAFYCGEQKELRQDGDNVWRLFGVGGKQLTAFVVKEKGRFLLVA